MGSPVIFNGANAKFINSGEVVDKNGLIYPRTGQKNYIGAAQSCSVGWTGYGTVTPSTDVAAIDLPRANTTASGWKLTPSGATSGTFTCTSATPAVLTATAHGMQTGYTVTVSNSGGALPTGLAAATVYYVNVLTANTFNVATSMANLIAGTYVATSSTGTGTQSFTFGGAYLRFALDAADYNVKQQLQWAQNIISGTTGDWEVDVYSNTAATWTGSAWNFTGTYTRLPLTPTDDPTTKASVLPNLEGTYRTTFDAPGAAAQYIELRWNKLAANTHALVGSDLISGPGTTVQGAAVSDPATFVPTTSQGFGTLASTSLQYIRSGSSIRVLGKFQAGTVAASEARLGLPNSWTCNAPSGTPIIGRWWIDSNTAAARKTGTIICSDLQAYVKFGNDDYTTAAFPAAGMNGSAFAVNSQVINVDFTVPVSDLIGSGTVNFLTSSVVSANARIQVVSSAEVVTAGSVIQFASGTNFNVGGGTFSGGAYTVPAAGKYQVFGPIRWTTTADNPINVCVNGGVATQCYINGDGSYNSVVSCNAGDTISLKNGAAGSLTTASSIVQSMMNIVRLADYTTDQAVGFGAASNTSRGIVYDPKQYVAGTAYTNGTITFTGAPAGWVPSRAVFVPYQTSDGAWRLRFNVSGSFTAASITSTSLTVTGIASKNVTSYFQSVSGMWLGNSGQALSQAYVSPNGGLFNFFGAAGVTVSGLAFSGDIELDSKPTWAD